MSKLNKRRWRRLLLLAVLVAGCDFPGKPKLSDQYVPPQKEIRFSVLFQQNCAGCHGADGKLGPAPPLNDQLFLTLVPDGELQRVVAKGRAATLMPAFAAAQGGQFTPEQVRILAEGIKEHWGSGGPAPSGAPPLLPMSSKPDTKKSAAKKPKKTGGPEDIPVAPRLVDLGAPTHPKPQETGKSRPVDRTDAQTRSDDGGAGNRDAGLKVFARACASCHGNQGQGGKSAGAINDPNFLALISDQALRRFVITGRPDLGMPDYAGTKGRPADFKPLTSQEVMDLVALLASWRR